MRLLALSALALPVFAGITPGYPPSSDVQILNFMCTLEQLDNALLEQGLKKFTPADFVRAGLPPFTRGRLEQMRKHSEIHTAFLRQAIADSGSAVVQPCTYLLPLEDPRSWINAGRDIATILASASYGAIGQMGNADYRTTLGSISGSISRQAGWLNSAVLEQNAWNTAFDPPLTFRQAWTAVQRYISDSPPENAMRFSSGLLDPFTPLEIIGTPSPGSQAGVNFANMEETLVERLLYIVFMTGIGELRTTLQMGGVFIVPRGVANLGAVFAFVTCSDGPIVDESVLAGPALMWFDSSSEDVF